MEELWINTQEDWSDFASFMQETDSKLISTYSDKDGLVVYEFQDMKVHVPNEYHNTNDFKKSPIIKTIVQEYKENPGLDSSKYDPLIFGRDSTEKIVNITVDNEIVYIYKSDGTCETKEYYNWALGANWTEGATRLKGNQFYKFIKELPEDQFYQLKNNWNPRIWTSRSAPEGYMLRSGSTYYKGLKVSDVSLLSFDIEATSLDKDDPEAFVPLVSMTFRDNLGKIENQLFDVFDYENPDLMWEEINQFVLTKNPDIILGHNILSYDLPYLDKNSSGIKWGRDSSRILFEEKASKKRKDGSQSYEYFNSVLNGREIIDTFFLSLTYDLAREFPGYSLKAIEQHLGLTKEDRTWDFKQWSVKRLLESRRKGETEMWNKFREYCREDSLSPIAMFDLMIPSFFYLCQTVPLSLQQIVNTASGSQINSFLVRAYLQDGFSIPRSDKVEEVKGGISFGVPGLYKNLVKVDLKSAYPSQILRFKLFDSRKDPEGYFYQMVKHYTYERFDLKKKFIETGDKYYYDREQTAKTFINSAYGVLNTNFLNFNSPKLADKITLETRNCIDMALNWASGKGVDYWMKLFRERTGKDEIVENEI